MVCDILTLILIVLHVVASDSAINGFAVQLNAESVSYCDQTVVVVV